MTEPLDDVQLIERVPLLRQGYYRTKGGFTARLDTDIVSVGLGVVREIGYVAYTVTGEFAYKDEPYDPHPGDSLDLLVETWQSAPFMEKQNETKTHLERKLPPQERALLVEKIEAAQMARIKVSVVPPIEGEAGQQLQAAGCEPQPYITFPHSLIFAATIQSEQQLDQLLAHSSVQKIESMPVYTLS